MPDRNNRAELGEQMSASSRDMNENMESERMLARESESGRDDRNAGDEGIDESPKRSSRNASRISRNSRSSMKAASRPKADRSEQSESDSSSFEGQGGQKEGDFDNAQGTGYTNDRSGQLQEDGSLSGTQGRHGKTGSRQGGQTAQNPRESDDVDRSVM